MRDSRELIHCGPSGPVKSDGVLDLLEIVRPGESEALGLLRARTSRPRKSMSRGTGSGCDSTVIARGDAGGTVGESAPRREGEGEEVPCARCVPARGLASGSASTAAPGAASTAGKGKPSSSVIGVGVGVVNFASASARKACFACSSTGALSSRMRARRAGKVSHTGGGKGGMRWPSGP